VVVPLVYMNDMEAVELLVRMWNSLISTCRRRDANFAMSRRRDMTDYTNALPKSQRPHS
jgi:hypothetical protein